MRHLTGDSRHQSTLLPDTLDDYVEADHPVRVIDAFVDTLDVSALGFSKAETKATGRKPYHPADLLKLYIYGYLNQVRASRRLEKECHRNLELLWLMKRLAPDFKTIADFRKDNGPAIRNTCQAFVRFCQQADLLTGRLVAIDGSKFKAAASKGQAITRKQLREQRRRVGRLVDQYLRQLDEADQATGDVELERERVQQALQQLEKEGRQLDRQAATMEANGHHQHCATEPDARLMRSGREGMVLGYNVQTAVDADSGLIVHHEVTQDGGDNRQLQPMAEAAKEQLTAASLEVIADAGYSNGEQLAACEAQGITATVPGNRAINTQGGHFQKHEFTYDTQHDHYTCPAGQVLHYKTYNTKDKLRLYTRTGCAGCALKPHCTSAENRWLSRHFHEEAFARSEARLNTHPGLMRQRMAIVERPYAVLKQVLGLRRFLCWGLSGAKAEMGIGVLSYNLNQVIHQVGVKNLLVALA